jgi:hypothetical protein
MLDRSSAWVTRAKRSTAMARGWKIIAQEAARTACTVASFGLVAYLGMNTIIKIEATRTRLFLVVVVCGVAFGTAYLMDHLMRDRVPTDTQLDRARAEIWPVGIRSLARRRDGETLRERLRGQSAFGLLRA